LTDTPVIFWFRSDLRLADNPGLAAARDTGKPVIAVYILDDVNPGIWKQGGAARWWLHQSLKELGGKIPLTLRKGDAAKEIARLVKETGASAVFWNRRYEPWAMARDKKIKESLKGDGIEAHSFGSFLMFEPWEIQNKTGGSYKVFTPYSKACLDRGGIRQPLKTGNVEFKKFAGLKLGDLDLMPEIKWYKGMQEFWQPGEEGGQARLKEFVKQGAGKYKQQRDLPAIDGTSLLSPYLHFGEISPHQVWHAVSAMLTKNADALVAANGQAYLRQLLWREFSWHLLYHSPDFPEQPWNKRFTKFPWIKNNRMLKLWQRGQTGYPIVDAGMRQLWQTGWMHNRVRMIVGSFLVKNLLISWRDGEDWFWDTLVDADLGNNAAGWQWIGGCGADAAPYFRIFNPLLQSAKFDPAGEYIKTYVPELKNVPAAYIHAPWDAPPLVLAQAGVTLGKNYPHPVVDHGEARARALKAYGVTKTGDDAADQEYDDQ
jgi:deoxyribodipyrimidine photo-lyase